MISVYSPGGIQKTLEGLINSTELKNMIAPDILDILIHPDIVFFLNVIELDFNDSNDRSKLVGQIRDFCKYSSGEYQNAHPVIHFLPAIEDQLLGCFVPRNLAFIDSSIWHFAAWDKHSFEIALKKIAHYQKKGYYNLIIAQESANLSYKIISNCFISDLDSKEKGHGNEVSPFLFHSESNMSQMIVKTIQYPPFSAILNAPMPITWRVLLLDDHSSKVMGCKKNLQSACSCKNCIEKLEVTKKQIIDDRLHEITVLSGYKIDFELHCVSTIDQAVDQIHRFRYDVILVDYLLKETDQEKEQQIKLFGKKWSKGEKVIREYGYMLLSNIRHSLKKRENETDAQKKTRKEMEAAKGICGKFWFMFSSGFTYAVQERLLAEGYSHSDENWYIGRTACPTTTPELFKYNLLSLMKRQLNYISEQAIGDSSRTVDFIDFLRDIFGVLKNVQSCARKQFDSLLCIRARYKMMKKDYYMGGKDNEDAKKNGSPLIQSLFPDMDCYNNAFWEHVQHLIYLVAFGNSLQWNEMWDEYILIRENLKRGEAATCNPGVCDLIENYIIGIKNINFK